MTLDELANSSAFDWDSQCVWLQRTGIVSIVRRGANGTEWLLQRESGAEFSLTDADVQEQYFEIDGGEKLKPRYAPIFAHYVKQDLEYQNEAGQRVELRTGSAVVRCAGGGYTILSVQEAEHFSAVNYPGEKDYPSIPFPHLNQR